MIYRRGDGTIGWVEPKTADRKPRFCPLYRRNCGTIQSPIGHL